MSSPSLYPHGITFHHFHDDKHYRGQGSISQKEFDNILNYIGIHRILSPDEWFQRLEKKTLSKEDVCLTFDDGLHCQIDIALPVLEHYNLKAYWFVYSNVFQGKLEITETYRQFRSRYFENIDDFYALFFDIFFKSKFSVKTDDILNPNSIKKYRQRFPFYSENDAKFRLIRNEMLERVDYEKMMELLIQTKGLNKIELSKNLWMSDDDLRYLNRKGHMIGLHSYSHPTALDRLSYEDQYQEYQRNYSHLTQVCGKPPISMSHPCDSYNNDTLEILRSFGIRCGFRANLDHNQEQRTANPNKLELPRQDHSSILSALD